MITEMQNHITGNLLRFAAGRAITCPKCGNILDWRTTTLVTLRQNGEDMKTWTQCTPCAEGAMAGLLRACREVAIKTGAHLDVEKIDHQHQEIFEVTV